jgi:hypothetical protein
MVANRLLGVLAVESEQLGAFTDADESVLTVLAHVVASAIELDRGAGRTPTTPLSSHQTMEQVAPSVEETLRLRPSGTSRPMAAPLWTAGTS